MAELMLNGRKRTLPYKVKAICPTQLAPLSLFVPSMVRKPNIEEMIEFVSAPELAGYYKHDKPNGTGRGNYEVVFYFSSADTAMVFRLRYS